jgi:hypothetical protein
MNPSIKINDTHMATMYNVRRWFQRWIDSETTMNLVNKSVKWAVNGTVETTYFLINIG